MKKRLIVLIVAGALALGVAIPAIATTVPNSTQGQTSSPVSGTVQCNLSSGVTDTVVLSGTAGQATITVNQTCSENAP